MPSKKEKQNATAQLNQELADLRQREQSFRTLIEQSPDLIARFDRELRYIYVNPALCQITGISFEDYIGKTVRELGMPEKWANLWDAASRQVFQTAQENVIEFEFETPQGQRVLEARIVPELIKDGIVETIIGFSRDITSHKRAKEALQTSQNRLTLTVEVTGLGIYEHAVPLDDNTYHSERWAEMLGYKLEELPPPATRLEWVLEQVHPDDLSTIAAAYTDFVEGRTQGYIVEIRMKHKSGEWIWVKGYSKALERNDNGGVTRILGIMQDITAHKQSEEFLRHQTEILQSIIDNIPIMLAFFDATGRFLLVNREWERVLGWTFDEVKERTDILNELYPDPDYRQSVLKVRMLENPGWHEFKTTTRDGHVIDIAWTSVRLSDGTNVGIGQDVTELKQVREQFYQAQKMEAIGRLAGGIAHDFNNVLVPIIGYAELGMRKLSPEDKLYTDLMQITQAGERAASLTKQILAFSRQQVLEMRVLDLNEVIDEFKKMLERLIGEDIELRTLLAPSLYWVKADQGQIDQVLMNLVVNARDAMPQGGKLTIETANVFLDERYAARHAETRPGPHVMLAVSDTGHGMDAETQARIFDPFFTTKEHGKGTGLGLATVFGIVKQHQGNIWVYSEPGSGTTFKIYLPQSTDIPLTRELAMEELISVYGTETVLVVEDEEMVRKLVCETLESYGYYVIEAANPEYGLQLAADYRDAIDLLLTDVIMPGMNGRQLYKKLVEFHPDSQVLYMSGYTDNVIVHHHILDEGVNFLQKPFSVDSLMEKVRKVLG